MTKRRWQLGLGLMGVGALGLFWACEEATNPSQDAAPAGNRAPEIRSVKVEPETVARGGTATVSVVATDPDGHGLIFTFSAQHGQLTKDPQILGRARYVHDGSTSTADTIAVRVSDSWVDATGSVGVTVKSSEASGPALPSCPDSFCGAGENCSNCPQDCGCSPGLLCSAGACTTCGNGACEAGSGENCTTCTKDCSCSQGYSCQTGVCKLDPLCPNKVCGSGENCSTCPLDCGCPGTQACLAGGVCSLCGNRTCDSASGENCSTCAEDCGCSPGYSCSGGSCVPPPFTVTVIATPTTCHPPNPTTPCAVTCTATASNGNAGKTFSWSDCASGSGSSASCSVSTLEPKTHTCTVSVSDGIQPSVSASATAKGVNSSPTCWVDVFDQQIPHLVYSDPIWFHATDTDGDDVSRCADVNSTRSDIIGIGPYYRDCSQPFNFTIRPSCKYAGAAALLRVVVSDAWNASGECYFNGTCPDPLP